MAIVTRHYLREELHDDFQIAMQQFAEALWIEDRQMNVMAVAIGKALGGK